MYVCARSEASAVAQPEMQPRSASEGTMTMSNRCQTSIRGTHAVPTISVMAIYCWCWQQSSSLLVVEAEAHEHQAGHRLSHNCLPTPMSPSNRQVLTRAAV